MPTYKYENTNRQTRWRTVFTYTDWTGEPKQKCKRGFKTQREAKQWETDFKANIKADLQISFEKFVEIYRADKKLKLKARTMENKRYVIDTHIKPYLGQMSMNEITASTIIKWENEMLTKEFSEAYLYMIYKELNAVMNHAVRFYGLKENPCTKVGKIGNSKTKSLTFWTEEEYKSFSKVLDDRNEYLYFVLFDILFYTGMRIGEVLALNKKDFDFSNNTISVTKTYYRRNKTDFITKPKTEQSVRNVVASQFLMNEVSKLISMEYGCEKNDRIFPITIESVQHKIKRIAELAGVKRIRVHDLRHSHISMLIEKGVAPLTIAERVGHDVQITLSVYAHLYPNKQQEIADLLDKRSE